MAAQVWDWERLGYVANVVQIVGVDARALISMVGKRREKARRNRDECQQLAQDVEAIRALLPLVRRGQPEIDGVLAKVEAALREADEVVAACARRSGRLRRLLRSGGQAEQFRRVREKIEFYLQLFPLIGRVDAAASSSRSLADPLDGGVESPQTQDTSDSNSNVEFMETRRE